VAGGSAAEARVGAASASALSGVGCVVGGGRDVVLALELALDEWCSCKKLKQSNHDMQYCAQYLSNKLQFKHPGESVVIQ
jgi:hypothetical protein